MSASSPSYVVSRFYKEHPQHLHTIISIALLRISMSDELPADNTDISSPPPGGSKLSQLRAKFDKTPIKIKAPTQYQHGKGHAINNLSSTDQEPIHPLGKNINPNSSAYNAHHSADFTIEDSKASPVKELKTWDPKPRRHSAAHDRPIFAHDQRPLNPFGKNVNPNVNAVELLEDRVKASAEFEENIGRINNDVGLVDAVVETEADEAADEEAK
jgi:hypothetical protein